ncbi:radical SAM/Cys-rich domain protein [Pseudomaricurvus alkylphenolicus]|uniref:arsenosugar biosynthesis radical SAM (seleno)protein ArsS n=1 Tax=Pseudomaricurvus alkylphenolicus TaxID=1306991 RepID=UPI0014249EEC|nr:arsenosugar biosynthesis radical SAM (seleno)protein ArsS [Pseudomaricurvus alkylphenolicus]NIB43268.1 radical SAM/Cys-rich domain protein [Pseudomaricurvus alkylphenolicus]
MHDSTARLRDSDFPALKRGKLSTLQVNLGYLCNLSCTHCHVNAGPRRTELMSREVIDQLLDFIRARDIHLLDLTGGAPEMNPHFRYFVTEARKLGVEVIDRCNLTILLEPGYEDLAEFLAEQAVQVTASLPCYEEANVAEQRGKGVYQQSIEALQLLNGLGYGKDPRLSLDLVYNPNGAFLPPPQGPLEQDYKAHLRDDYGIEFNQLLTITNMPISRFGSMLISKGQFDSYMQLLKDNFSQDNLASVMCHQLISVDWQGYVYDCDFNQMLGWGMVDPRGDQIIARDSARTHIADLLEVDLEGDSIVVGEHCYGCTAGQGSSCGGALS